MSRWLPALLGGVLALFVLTAALAVACSYNPTPTNASGGGPGSAYPHTHHAASYSRPVDGNGPQSS